MGVGQDPSYCMEYSCNRYIKHSIKDSFWRYRDLMESSVFCYLLLLKSNIIVATWFSRMICRLCGLSSWELRNKKYKQQNNVQRNDSLKFIQIHMKIVGVNISWWWFKRKSQSQTFPSFFPQNLHYNLIAFDERVIFWLKRAQPLPCARVFAELFARALA